MLKKHFPTFIRGVLWLNNKLKPHKDTRELIKRHCVNAEYLFYGKGQGSLKKNFVLRKIDELKELPVELDRLARSPKPEDYRKFKQLLNNLLEESVREING